MRCQTPPVVSLGENSEQIFGWKQGEDDWNGMMMIMRIAQPPSESGSRGEQRRAVESTKYLGEGGAIKTAFFTRSESEFKISSLGGGRGEQDCIFHQGEREPTV